MAAILLAIKAWSIWSRFGAWLSALVSWAMKNPWPALAVVAIVGNAVQLHIHKGDLKKLATIAAAQKTATAAQIAVNQAPAIDSATIARQSDAQAPLYYAAVAAAADAHRVIMQPAPCPISPPGVPGPAPAPPINDRPDPAAIMVSRPKSDDDLILAAAARAAQMHHDAMTLIGRGDAVPDDAPAPAVQ